MPILASTVVMPELIPVTYAKLRAELAAALAPGDRMADLVILGDQGHVLVNVAGRLPQVVPRADEPIWRAAIRGARERGASDVELIGWAGDRYVGSGRSALLVRAVFPEETGPASGNRLAPVHELLTENDAPLVRSALRQLGQLDSC
jgi:ATP adenylyltransferase